MIASVKKGVNLASAVQKDGPWLLGLLKVMLGICLCNNPAAEAGAKCKGNFGAPLVESLPLDHVLELEGLNAQLVDWVFKLLELLIDLVHNVLLALSGIGHVMIMIVLIEIIVVSEATWFDISRYS